MGLLSNSNAIESGGYNIERSLRFRSSASAYLSRTPASAGNQQKSTISFWVKRGALGVEQGIYTTRIDDSNKAWLFFTSADTLQFFTSVSGSYQSQIITTQVFRDPSAWYHVVVYLDTTQATASQRIVLYVNGVQVTALSTATYPAQNANLTWNIAQATAIGREQQSTPVNYFDGYLAEINFIDGQALTPSSFGQTDPVTGVWQPKKYTGTYGTNGFYLNFKDNTSATTLAYDKSGNGNNWTANNISTTAGATYDSMTDVPTLTSATAANYCVLNPLDKASTGTLSNGNLQWVTPNDANNYGLLATFGINSGKWYWEAVITNVVAYSITAGFVTQDWAKNYIGSGGTAYFGLDTTNGVRASAGITTSGSTVTVGLNDVIGIAFDADAKTATIYKNNTSIYTYSNIPNVTLFPAVSSASNTVNVNFGQRPFSYTPPTGFKSLNTFNLPDPVIKKPNQYMDATLATGNNGTQTIVNAGGFQPDFVWMKVRDIADNHISYDSVRGVQNYLSSNLTSAEGTNSQGLTSFNSNGFTLGNINPNYTGSHTFVAWQWKKGATPGFDIVTYTGTGAGQVVSHSLGVAPAMIIPKNRSNAGNWHCYHKSLGATQGILLNATNAASTDSGFWNNTAPTSTNFTAGTYNSFSGQTYVAYLFAEIPGFSKFGSYTGNGSADGPFVYCGFRPKFVLWKRSDAAGNDWRIFDTSRDLYNASNHGLYPDTSGAEDLTAGPIDIVSNGFKMRATGAGDNASGGTYIFCAFAENPFKYSLAR